MLLPDTAERAPGGRLWIGGCDVAELAGRFGTPLYVYDEATLRSRLAAYRRAIRAWPAGGDVLYSAKAFLCTAMVRLLRDEDCGIDVVSGGELEVALRAGMAASRIGFPGNNKDAAEIGLAASAGIGHLVVDSEHELDLVAGLASGRPLPALLRLSPGIRPDTHDFISTGQLDSKFGFSVENGQAMAATRRALAVQGLHLRGFHIHIGSQIFELRSYPAALEIVADFCADLRGQTGKVTDHLSVGGGLGIAHLESDDPPTIHQFMTIITESVKRSFAARDLPLPALMVEPGRSVAGPAGMSVYRVGARKTIPGVRSFVAVDGGMADNIRPKLYGARYQPIAVDDDGGGPRETVTLAGRYCESTDILATDCDLPRLTSGDLVALPAAGAYTLSMASNYNLAPRPAVVFVRDGAARLVRRRETVDDWLGLDVVEGPSQPR